MEDVQLGGASCGTDCGDDAHDDRRDEDRHDRAERNLNRVDERFGKCHRHGDAEWHADNDTESCPEDRHDDRLPAHRSLQLAAGHADGAEQAELARTFEDREGHGVGNAEHGDGDRKDEQRIHDEQQLVQLVFRDLRSDEEVDRLSGGHRRECVESDEPVACDTGVGVHAAHFQRLLRAVLPGDVEAVAHTHAIVASRVFV